MRIVLIPSSFAISQACCPPAPPKLASLYGGPQLPRSLTAVHGTHTCFPVAYPLASVRARMGLHIVSFATLMNLSARSTSRHTRYSGNFLTHMLLHLG